MFYEKILRIWERFFFPWKFLPDGIIEAACDAADIEHPIIDIILTPSRGLMKGEKTVRPRLFYIRKCYINVID